MTLPLKCPSRPPLAQVDSSLRSQPAVDSIPPPSSIPFLSNHNPPVIPINNTSAMPFRTAVRFTARFSAPRTVTHHIARRAASSSAGPKAGSDTPWIIGSAVGFGTLVRESVLESRDIG